MVKGLKNIILAGCVISLTACPKPPLPTPVWFGKLSDFTELNVVTVDSSTTPYTKTTYDTVFQPHSQFGYAVDGPYGDSIVYINYQVTPNTTLVGTIKILSGNTISSRIMLNFPSIPPDTVNYLESDNKIFLSHTINNPPVSQTITQIFTDGY